jgi:hypothetical protein
MHLAVTHAHSGLTARRLILECYQPDFWGNASGADRCVILMALDFQPTDMGDVTCARNASRGWAV